MAEARTSGGTYHVRVEQDGQVHDMPGNAAQPLSPSCTSSSSAAASSPPVLALWLLITLVLSWYVTSSLASLYLQSYLSSLGGIDFVSFLHASFNLLAWQSGVSCLGELAILLYQLSRNQTGICSCFSVLKQAYQLIRHFLTPSQSSRNPLSSLLLLSASHGLGTLVMNSALIVMDVTCVQLWRTMEPVIVVCMKKKRSETALDYTGLGFVVVGIIVASFPIRSCHNVAGIAFGMFANILYVMRNMEVQKDRRKHDEAHEGRHHDSSPSELTSITLSPAVAVRQQLQLNGGNHAAVHAITVRTQQDDEQDIELVQIHHDSALDDAAADSSRYGRAGNTVGSPMHSRAASRSPSPAASRSPSPSPTIPNSPVAPLLGPSHNDLSPPMPHAHTLSQLCFHAIIALCSLAALSTLFIIIATLQPSYLSLYIIHRVALWDIFCMALFTFLYTHLSLYVCLHLSLVAHSLFTIFKRTFIIFILSLYYTRRSVWTSDFILGNLMALGGISLYKLRHILANNRKYTQQQHKRILYGILVFTALLFIVYLLSSLQRMMGASGSWPGSAGATVLGQLSLVECVGTAWRHVSHTFRHGHVPHDHLHEQAIYGLLSNETDRDMT